MSNLKSTMDLMFQTNGMDVEYIENLTEGSKLVFAEKIPEFSEPFEITIVSNETKTVEGSYSDDFEDIQLITDTLGNTYIVDIAMMIPSVQGYEIYPNFQVYFQKMQDDIDAMESKIKRTQVFVDEYYEYKEYMIKTSPEKVI